MAPASSPAPVAVTGVVAARGELLASGASRSALRHRVATGRWQRLLPRVYLLQSGAADHVQRLRAALLYAGLDAAIDCVTALHIYGVRYLPADDRIHVVIPHARRIAGQPGIVIRRSTFTIQRRWWSGLPVVPLGDALVAASREVTQLRAVRAIVADAVQRRLLTIDELRRAGARAPHRGGAAIRRAVADVVAGCRSAPEAEFRDLVRGLRSVPEPLWNPRVVLDDDSVVSPDAYWQEARLVHEVDSREHHAALDRFEATLARHTRMTAAGLLVLHNTPARLRREPQLVRRDIVAAYRAGLRLGPAPGVQLTS